MQTHLCGTSHTGFCRKILCRNGTGQSNNRQEYQQQTSIPDIAEISVHDTHVNNRRNDQRHVQLK